jgi:type II secretory pathway pseudopilin PulG
MLRACTALALMGVLAAGAVVLTAQQRSGGSVAQTATDTEAAIKAAEESARKEAEALKNWTPSRTAWGDPDLRGVCISPRIRRFSVLSNSVRRRSIRPKKL